MRNKFGTKPNAFPDLKALVNIVVDRLKKN